MKPLLLFLSLLWAVPGLAQITHVANDVCRELNSNFPLTLTVASTGAGHLLFVGVSWIPNTSTATVSGNGSGAFTASSLGQINNNRAVEGFYLQNPTGGDTTITVTVSGTPTRVGACFFEFSGNATSGGEDGTASGTGTGTALLTGTLTSTGTTDVVIGWGGSSVTGTWSAGSGFTLTTGTNGIRNSAEWQIFTSAVNQTVALSTTGSGSWVMEADAFKASGGGAAAAGFNKQRRLELLEE